MKWDFGKCKAAMEPGSRDRCTSHYSPIAYLATPLQVRALDPVRMQEAAAYYFSEDTVARLKTHHASLKWRARRAP